LGTFELNEIQSHTHQSIDQEPFLVNKAGDGGGSGNVHSTVSNTAYTGGFETRPVNANVLWVINY
jgi:hypothetical protein